VSDHLPVRVDLQLPSRIAAPVELAMGDVIGGAVVPLAVGNPATTPADALDYSFTAPAGSPHPPATSRSPPARPTRSTRSASPPGRSDSAAAR